jgi:hypothetical protein
MEGDILQVCPAAMFINWKLGLARKILRESQEPGSLREAILFSIPLEDQG